MIENNTGKTIIGTAQQILARGNTFADYPAGTTDLRTHDRRTFTLADDTAISFTPLMPQGVVSIRSAANLVTNMWTYEVDSTPNCKMAFDNTQSGASTVALTGTTGSDGNFTVSAVADGKIYIENRKGSAITITVTIDT